MNAVSVASMAANPARLDARAERRLFASLRMAGGIFKTTEPGRLRDVDAATIAALFSHRPLREILDVGASSGTTSLEWLHALRAAGASPRLTATDLSIHAALLAPWPGYRVLVDGTDRPLRHLIAGVAIRPWCRRLDYVTQNWLVVALANALFHHAERTGALADARATARPVLLVAPRVAADPHITLEEEDVFAAPPAMHLARFDIVRAANLLLPSVFDEAKLRAGIAGLKARLAGPGALLVIARTLPRGGNHATIFAMGADARLAVRSRVGNGSEIEALVLSV